MTGSTPYQPIPVKRRPREVSLLYPFARGFPGFAAATIAIAAVAGWAMTLAFTGAGDASAIALSAVVASVIQIVAFPAIRALATKNMLVGWGAGSLVRLISLPLYGLLVVKVLLLPAAPALMSLFVCYFLSMVIEPLFLRP